MKLVLFMSLFILASCSSREHRAKEERIQQILSIQWKDGIVPLDEIHEGYIICHPKYEFKGCDSMYILMSDIAVTYASCLKDQRSTSCKKIIADVIKHKIFSTPPDVNEAILPSDPFYFRLPTRMLETYAEPYNYRKEIAAMWLLDFKYELIFLILLVLASISLYVWKIIHKVQHESVEAADSEVSEETQTIVDAKAAEELRNKLETEEKISEIRKKQHAEKLRLIALASEKEKLARKRIEQEKIAKERAEADELLAAIFSRKK